jgi:hypothetical protein
MRSPAFSAASGESPPEGESDRYNLVMTIKNLLKRFVPTKYHSAVFLPGWLAKQSQGQVMSGPFKGLKYVSGSVSSAYYPKLLGTYEIELRNIVVSLFQRGFDLVLNVGAAEGYYAVGFSVKCPDSQIIAFEADEEGQRLLAEMAQLNQVEKRLLIKGYCDSTTLQSFIQNANEPLIIMDIEGGEKDLLDPKKIAELRYAHILVELHDFVYRDISQLIKDRFQDSHTMVEVCSRERKLEDLPGSISLFIRYIFRQHFLSFMQEWRPEKMTWLYLQPFAMRSAVKKTSDVL